MPMDYADILAYQALTQRASAAAQATYNQSMAANSGEDLAIKRAQNAFSNALQASELSGYFGAGVGNGTVAGQPTLPNLQNTLSAFGSYVPGALAQLPGGTLTQSAIAQQQALSGQQLANQLAISQATGMFARPVASQYSPGTVLTAPSTTPGLGPAYGVVNADGSVQMVTSQGLDQLAAQRGTTAQAMTKNAQPVDWNTLQGLSMGPPTSNATPTMALQQQQYDQAERNAQLTGILNDPNSTV